MKNFLLIAVLFLLLTSCNSTSGFFKPKEVATPRGLYNPQNKIAEETNSEKKSSKKAKSKRKSKHETSDDNTTIEHQLNLQDDLDLIIEDENTSYLVKQLIHETLDNIGVNYQSGGMSKNGFDCSGLIYTSFKKFDIELPRSSSEMAKKGLLINFENAQKGDLIFFSNRGHRRINHVGMIIEVSPDDIKFVHSSTQKGVIISSLKEPYYQKSFTQINRVIQ